MLTEMFRPGGHYLAYDSFVPVPNVTDGTVTPIAEPHGDYAAHLEILHRMFSFAEHKKKMAPMKNHLADATRPNNATGTSMTVMVRG